MHVQTKEADELPGIPEHPVLEDALEEAPEVFLSPVQILFVLDLKKGLWGQIWNERVVVLLHISTQFVELVEGLLYNWTNCLLVIGVQLNAEAINLVMVDLILLSELYLIIVMTTILLDIVQNIDFNVVFGVVHVDSSYLFCVIEQICDALLLRHDSICRFAFHYCFI